MKKYTIEEIAAHLQDVASFECEDIPAGTGRYYLHITYNGELAAYRGEDTVTFTSDYINIADIKDVYTSYCEENGYNLSGLESMDCIYDFEDLKYDHFRSAVESLTEQVNAWIEEQEDESI